MIAKTKLVRVQVNFCKWLGEQKYVRTYAISIDIKPDPSSNFTESKSQPEVATPIVDA